VAVIRASNPSLNYPVGLSVDGSGTVYVSDYLNDRVVVFFFPSAPITTMKDSLDRLIEPLEAWNWLVLFFFAVSAIGLIIGLIQCVRQYGCGKGDAQDGFYNETSAPLLFKIELPGWATSTKI